MHFLKISKYCFIIFTLFGLLDSVSTIILIHHHGIGVEANPLIRAAFEHMSFYCFIPHILLVLFLAYHLSRPSWNNRPRSTVKSGIFYLYIFIVINNWYQVAQLGYQTVVANILS